MTHFHKGEHISLDTVALIIMSEQESEGLYICRAVISRDEMKFWLNIAFRDDSVNTVLFEDLKRTQNFLLAIGFLLEIAIYGIIIRQS